MKSRSRYLRLRPSLLDDGHLNEMATPPSSLRVIFAWSEAVKILWASSPNPASVLNSSTPRHFGAPLSFRPPRLQRGLDVLNPVSGNLLSCGHPDVLVGDVGQETAEGDYPPGLSDYPVVEAYGHHLGVPTSFLIECVERVFEILEEL